jgi:hypothetical protein
MAVKVGSTVSVVSRSGLGEKNAGDQEKTHANRNDAGGTIWQTRNFDTILKLLYIGHQVI